MKIALESQSGTIDFRLSENDLQICAWDFGGWEIQLHYKYNGVKWEKGSHPIIFSKKNMERRPLPNVEKSLIDEIESHLDQILTPVNILMVKLDAISEEISNLSSKVDNIESRLEQI